MGHLKIDDRNRLRRPFANPSFIPNHTHATHNHLKGMASFTFTNPPPLYKAKLAYHLSLF